MNNETTNGIELNTQDDVKTAVSMISEGYAEMDTETKLSHLDQQREEIRRRIEAKEFEGLADIDLISYGLNQLAEDTTQRKTAKKAHKAMQVEREKEQAKLFTSVPYDSSQDKF
ncbi:hypothetical protein [Aerococcus viridans]|uniref:hypothetical protein n=1 Tax=Aerococcus viridans TaxID=1377 RepID=UPI002DB798F0|nr:hypothetical protein [Aerococcus viridans]MEC1386516.1 hypothetical protein [Aerococcus viridans]